ncbi:MAG: hypothetical protein P4L57_16520 [Rhizomicrobium sp.]|nr:hypothetical protein [Rhizomicrobium sp.]
MKTLRFILLFILMSGTACAQALDTPKTFAVLKSLAGTWEGPSTVDPPQPGWANGKVVQFILRDASQGQAVTHLISYGGPPEISVAYVDAGKLTLLHYCDAGNRPRLVAAASPDGKTITFDMVELSGPDTMGHLAQIAITTIDADHHVEDLIYMLPGNKPMHAHFDLKRVPEKAKP